MNPIDDLKCYHKWSILLLIYIFTISTLSSFIITPIQTASSFYGNSYIKLPFREYNNETKIEFRFKTYQPDAFLFLAAGSSDYCLIYLESGQLIVKINYGLGETYLSTEELKLNDLQWHHLQLEKIQLRLLLKIDDQRIYMNEINGLVGTDIVVQLKILYGIFLGSLNTFKSLYLGDLKPFRGCLDQIYFNGKNILELSEKQAIIHEVSLDKCDEEFSDSMINHSEEETISFVQYDSFVLLPGLPHYNQLKNNDTLSTTDTIVEFDLKTISTNALLLFNPGKNTYKKQYLVLELIQNRLKFLLNNGINENYVHSSITINDGYWHHVKMTVDLSQLVIWVDGHRETSTSNTNLIVQSRFKINQLSNELYLGGLSSDRQSLAINYGIESILIEQNVSLKGCIRNLQINYKMTSLLDAIATKHIQTGECRWNFFCLDPNKSPCLNKSKCSQIGINQIKCSCSQLNCIKKNFKNKSSTLKVESELLESNVPQSTTQTIILTEKSSSLGTMNDAPEIQNVHIKMLANSRLTLTPNFFQNNNNNKDSIQKHNKNMKKQKYEKIYKLLRINNPNDPLIETKNTSFLENINEPNVRINSFTETELKNGSIKFVHIGQQSLSSSNDSKIKQLNSIEVILNSYHESASTIDRARIVPEKEYHLIFKLYEINSKNLINTGLVMAHRTFKLITSQNLSLLLGEQNYDINKSQLIRFSLISEPKHGILQKLRSMPNNWVNVSQFNQRQIDRNKIRYLHTGSGKPKSDQLNLHVLFNKQLIKSIQFNINFVDNLELNSFGLNFYNFSKNEKEFILTPTEISFQTKPVLSDPRTILITLKSVPSYGTLYLFAANMMQKKLQIASNFTQKDIDEKRILYLRNNSFVNIDSIKDLVDSFTFNVSLVKNPNVAKISTFYIYFDDSSDNYVLINRKLTVLEGDKTLIDENHLFLKSVYHAIHHHSNDNNEDVIFDIIKPPKFGSIQIMYDDDVENNPERLPQKLIQQKKVFYQHDDSENNIDFFDFSIRNFSDNDVIDAKFSIEILMKNDNPPVRKTQNQLNIIENSEKILSESDLLYVDDDLNTGPENIVFSQIYSPNGEFFYTTNDSIAQRFTQQDINDGLIKFRHNGTDLARTIFSVTDGQFILSDSLYIKASNPYISIVNNSGIIVKYGETCIISSKNLSIETNLPKQEEIYIKLLTEPRLGQILINGKSTNHFSLKELIDDFVEYESTVFEDESPFSKNDSFEFRVFSNDPLYKELITKSQEFLIQIYPLSYFSFNVVNLNNLTSFEQSQTLIDRKILLIEHTELKPDQIIFTIIKNPLFGVIENLKNLDNSNSTNRTIQSFTQEDVNNGLIVYKSIKSYFDDYSVDRMDSFEFFVGNEIFKLKNLVIYIELIPNFITLTTGNLTVVEGNMAILTTEHIHLTHSYYDKFVNEFIVVEEPKYGAISLLSNEENIKLSAKSFTGRQLLDGKVCYQHDSSEFDKDWFTIVARANSINKESLPATVHITVSSINDEAPRVINLTDIDVWKNEMVQITNRSLAAIDEDSKPNEILFLISTPINGYLINIETNNTVMKFSQSDLDMGRIYFVHIGDGNGSFRFHLTDGKNYGSSNLLKLKVRRKMINIIANEKMSVTPGSQQSITNHHLQVGSSEPIKNIDPKIDDDDLQREFIYKIIKAPTYGRIILEGFKQQQEPETETEKEITFFTQKQLNENLVLYDQNVPLKNDPIIIDRIIFDIESKDMPTLKSVHFIVEISTDNFKDLIRFNTDSLISIESLIVTEGKISTISDNEINLHEFFSKIQIYDENKILLKVTGQPNHGIILKNGKILDNFQMFPPSLFRNNSLVYMHDDSNTFTDSVGFSIFINDDFQKSILNLTLPVKIIPVNDEYPQIITKNPHLKVNFGSETLINKEILNTKDLDGNDTNIIYLFRGENFTKEGHLSYLNNFKKPINQFTQQDINDEKIYFVHRGNKVNEILFWFQVKDDESIVCEHKSIPKEIHYEQLLQSTMTQTHCTDYYPFIISVIRLSIKLTNHTTIQLSQGSRRAIISNSNLAVNSPNTQDDYDDDLDLIIYRIKRGPSNGHILVANLRSLYFSQKQINQNQVYYMQENMIHEDSFMVDIFQKDNEKVIDDVEIKISVKPLVKAKKPFVTAYPGQQSLISIDHVDASELYAKTGSNPQFKLLKNPIYGTLNILQFGGDDLKSINKFTQEDIIQNRLIYQTMDTIEPSFQNEILIDVLEYELSAKNVQKAHGVLVVNIFNNQSTDPMEEIFIKNKYLSYLGMSFFKEQFFLLFIILFLIILIPTIIIIIRMCFLTWPTKSNKHTDHCPKNYLAQTLATACHHPDHHSSSVSSRPNDSSSHYSSSTTFDHSAVATNSDVQSNKSTQGQRLETINLNVLKNNQNYQPKKFIHDDMMSPLPPPSLYFINDQSFDHPNQWDQSPTTPPLIPSEFDTKDNTKQCLVETNEQVVRNNNPHNNNKTQILEHFNIDSVNNVVRRSSRHQNLGRSHRSHSPENGIKRLSRKKMYLDDDQLLMMMIDSNNTLINHKNLNNNDDNLHINSNLKNQYWI